MRLRIAIVALTLLAACGGEHIETNDTEAKSPASSSTTSSIAVTTTTIDPAVVAWYEGVARAEAEAVWWAEVDRQLAEQAARAEQQRAERKQSAPAATHTEGLGPCGGDLPPCSVKQRESGGDYGAVNPTGCGGRSCGGAWQFDPRTWNGYGGYARAEDAPPEVQDQKARETWAGGAGCSHWAAC